MHTFIRLTTEKQMQQNANKVQKVGNKSIKLLIFNYCVARYIRFNPNIWSAVS
jgi:hypothetical protein